MMKVAVDARPLNYPYTGIGRYTSELLARLTNSTHEWHLFFTPVVDYPFLHQQNVFVHKLGGSKFSDFIAINTLSFFKMKYIGVDVFWSPRHHLPVCMPTSIKTVVSIHDLVWMRVPKTMTKFGYFQERALMKYSVKKAIEVTAVSMATRKDLVEELSLDSDAITLVPPGLCVSFNQEARSVPVQLSPALPETYILFVGTHEPRKNLKRLLLAYAKLSVELKNSTSLVIAGAIGWGKETVRNVIVKLNLEAYVTVYDKVSDDMLVALYDHAMFLAMPSLYEGFGLPIIEALARGVPVLTSDIASMPEVAKSSALLVDPYSVNSIFIGLEKMIVDTELRESLIPEDGVSVYDWGESANQLLKLIESLASQPKSN